MDYLSVIAIEFYVGNHSDHLVIQKLKTNKTITETEINALENILFDGATVVMVQILPFRPIYYT